MEKKGLSVTTVWLMIAVALFFDTLQALLTPVVIGYFVPVISYPTFWLWFKLHGLSFFSLKRAPVLGSGAIIELIPGLDLLPAFTFTVARIALAAKATELTTRLVTPPMPDSTKNRKGTNDESTDDLSKAA